LEKALSFLARFSRTVSEVGTVEEILSLLVDALVEAASAQASAVVQIVGDDVKIVASRKLPASFEGWRADADELGVELEAAFMQTAKGAFARARVTPMISHRDLYGVALCLYEKGAEPPPHQVELGDALVDLAAISLGHFAQLDELRRAHDELRKAQRALVQAEKLRALGQMASGVAHDLKNLLNPLSMQVQIIERAVKKDDLAEIDEMTKDMRDVIARGVQTVDRLRDYGMQESEASAAPVDLNGLASEAAAIAKPRLSASKKKVPRIVLSLGTPPSLLGRSEEILNAIVNLTINAIDAMKDTGGSVTIETGEENGRAFARVHDTGPGMPPEVEARVFEPFFSTKGDEGTGLGLAMVYACMQHHAGSVDLETALGKGTSFTMRFPPAVK
jgi:signal transduction histidine kinase